MSDSTLDGDLDAIATLARNKLQPTMWQERGNECTDSCLYAYVCV